MKLLTQFVLVGHTVNRLVEGIKQFRIEKIILLVGDNPNLEGELKVFDVAQELIDLFGNIAMVEQKAINKEAIFQATIQILTLMLQEVKEEHDILLNVSGSLRQMAIACYIAALVTGTKIISVVPKYTERGEEIGIKEIHELPYFPIKEINKERFDVLTILEQESTLSIQDLVIKMFNTKSEQARAKINYYIGDLLEDGFIFKKRVGKEVHLELTETGKIMLLGHQIKKLKENPAN